MRRTLTAAAVSCLAIAGAFVAVSRAGALGDTTRDGELVADGAWCWFQDPRAVHYVGLHDRTYIGYVTSTGDIDVVSQDAGTAALAHTTLHAALQIDDHAAPGLVVLPDHRIAVFYSAHASGAMRYRISLRAEDITAFGPETLVPTNTVGNYGATYGNPIYLTAEHRLYVFFRGADFHPVMTWTSDYVHWSPAVDIAISDDVPATARPYVKYATNGVDTIAIAFTDGHPRDVDHSSIYEMVYQGGILRAPDGTPLSVLDPSAVTDQTLQVPHTGAIHTDWLRAGNGGLVYDDHPGGSPGWIESIALDAGGVPAIVYSTYQDVSNAPYYYTRWDGAGWATTHIADAGATIYAGEPQYSGGADLDRNRPGTVYLSKETTPGSGDWEIARWTAQDATLTPLTEHSTVKNIRPVAPTGPPGEIQVLWMSGRYAGYQYGAYDTQLREITSNLAPTSAAIAIATPIVDKGATIRIAADVAQGYQGDPVADTPVELLGRTTGQPDRVLRTGRTNAGGQATFAVSATVSTTFSVRMPATSAYGASTSPLVTVTVRAAPAVPRPVVKHPSVARIGTSATAIKHGQVVTVTMQAVDARNGANLRHVIIQLWQATAGHPWVHVGSYVTATGFVHLARRPGLSVTYQARLLAATSYLAAASRTAPVRVR